MFLGMWYIKAHFEKYTAKALIQPVHLSFLGYEKHKKIKCTRGKN